MGVIYSFKNAWTHSKVRSYYSISTPLLHKKKIVDSHYRYRPFSPRNRLEIYVRWLFFIIKYSHCVHFVSVQRAMCILFSIANGNPQSGGYKLIIASNRDEFYSRPASAAREWSDNPFVYGGMYCCCCCCFSAFLFCCLILYVMCRIKHMLFRRCASE